MEKNDVKYLFLELTDKTFIIIENSPAWVYTELSNNTIIPVSVIDSETEIRKNGWVNLHYVKTVFEMTQEDFEMLKEYHTSQKLKNIFNKEKERTN